MALTFGLWVASTRGATAASEYYAAYLLEFSLSIDNIFVFVIVFSELHIPPEHQRRVLGWAMVGLRSLYFVVSDAIDRLRYLRQGLAAVLVFTGTKMLSSEWLTISPGVSVGIIVLVLGVTMVMSAKPTRIAR